MNADKHRCIKD